MALGDSISNILIQVKAETKGAREKLHELNGALETIGKGAQFAREAMADYDEHLRLVTATANVNIESLSKAFRGLVNEHDMLTFAAQTQTGILALNQQEMEKVAQAALALRNRGFGAEEALKKLTDAAVKGKVGGLDDLGLSIKEGASQAETLRNMMTELDKVIKDSGEGYNQQADDVRRLATEWDNACAAAKRYTVEAMKAIDFSKIGELEKLMAAGMSRDEAMGELMSRQGARDDLATQRSKDRAQSALDRRKAGMNVIEMPDDNLSGGVAKNRAAAAERAKKLREAADKRAKDWTDLLLANLEDEFANRDPSSIVDQGIGSYDLPKLPGMGGIDLEAQLKKIEDANAAAANTAKKNTFLETHFGALEDFDAYAEAFSMLSGSVTSAMDAWIDGSMGAGEAIKKFLAGAMKGLATSMAVEALKHGAYAIGSLAFGDVAGASAHGTAAGLFAAGSAAAAVAAKELGGSASATAKGGSAGGASTGGGSVSNPRDHRTGATGPLSRDNSRPVVVVLGSAFDETTPRERARSAQAALDKAMRERDE